LAVKILVLGIGNPIMGDDGVGIHVARMVKDRFRSQADLEVKELGVGGLKLVEEILGHEEVYIVDSYATQDIEPGRIREFSPDRFEDTLHASSPHGTNFVTALELYRELEPQRIPEKIRIFTIDIKADYSFGESMSAPVREAASKLAELLATEIQQASAQRKV
jgi:hydrogenase maturation protease